MTSAEPWVLSVLILQRLIVGHGFEEEDFIGLAHARICERGLEFFGREEPLRAFWTLPLINHDTFSRLLRVVHVVVNSTKATSEFVNPSRYLVVGAHYVMPISILVAGN